jgi:hypothetical protein
MRWSKRFSVSKLGCFVLLAISSLALQPLEVTSKGRLFTKQDNPSQTRRLKFRHAIPEAVKILSVRHLQDSDWYDKLEFEIQNVSDKPIYYLLIWLTLRDVKPRGVPVAFSLVYGDRRLISLDLPLNSDDKPINPGEKAVLTVPEAERRGGARYIEEGVSLDVREIEVSVNTINFGDGTGYIGGAKATPRKKTNQSQRLRQKG